FIFLRWRSGVFSPSPSFFPFSATVASIFLVSAMFYPLLFPAAAPGKNRFLLSVENCSRSPSFYRHTILLYILASFLIRPVEYRLQFPSSSAPSRPYKVDKVNHRGRAVPSQSLAQQLYLGRQRRSNRKIVAAS